MSISTRLKEIIDEILSEEDTICEKCGEVHEGDCVNEANTTANVAGYETPMAFSSKRFNLVCFCKNYLCLEVLQTLSLDACVVIMDYLTYFPL